MHSAKQLPQVESKAIAIPFPEINFNLFNWTSLNENLIVATIRERKLFFINADGVEAKMDISGMEGFIYEIAALSEKAFVVMYGKSLVVYSSLNGKMDARFEFPIKCAGLDDSFFRPFAHVNSKLFVSSSGNEIFLNLCNPSERSMQIIMFDRKTNRHKIMHSEYSRGDVWQTYSTCAKVAGHRPATFHLLDEGRQLVVSPEVIVSPEVSDGLCEQYLIVYQFDAQFKFLSAFPFSNRLQTWYFSDRPYLAQFRSNKKMPPYFLDIFEVNKQIKLVKSFELPDIYIEHRGDFANNECKRIKDGIWTLVFPTNKSAKESAFYVLDLNHLTLKYEQINSLDLWRSDVVGCFIHGKTLCSVSSSYVGYDMHKTYKISEQYRYHWLDRAALIESLIKSLPCLALPLVKLISEYSDLYGGEENIKLHPPLIEKQVSFFSSVLQFFWQGNSKAESKEDSEAQKAVCKKA